MHTCVNAKTFKWTVLYMLSCSWCMRSEWMGQPQIMCIIREYSSDGYLLRQIQVNMQYPNKDAKNVLIFRRLPKTKLQISFRCLYLCSIVQPFQGWMFAEKLNASAVSEVRNCWRICFCVCTRNICKLMKLIRKIPYCTCNIELNSINEVNKW